MACWIIGVFSFGCEDDHSAQNVDPSDLGWVDGNHNDPDVGDQDAYRDVDVTTDDGTQQPLACAATSLKVKPNQCAEAHDFGPPWATGPLNLVPADLGIQQAWSYTNVCPSTGGRFATATLMGEKVVARGDDVVVLEVGTGEQLDCVQIEGEPWFFGISALDTLYFFFADDYYSGPTTAVKWMAVTPTAPNPVVKSLPGCAFDVGDVRLTPDGQIVVRTMAPLGIVSIDPLTTEVNWAVDDRQLKALVPSEDDFLTLSMGDMGFDPTTRELVLEPVPGTTLGIDSCGAVRARDGVAATVYPLGSGHVELTRFEMRVVSEDEQIVDQKQCSAMLSLAEDAYMCLNQGANGSMAMTIYQPGSPPLERVVSGPTPLNWNWLVASREGVLLISSADGIAFYDWRADTFVGHFAKPFESRNTMQVHDISPTGRVIAVLDDHVIAIDTNLSGVAPGPIPKPFLHGYGGHVSPW